MKPFFESDDSRRKLCESARKWIGTPFHYNAQMLGVGVDCVRLADAIYSDCGFTNDLSGASYRLGQGAHASESRLIDWLESSPKLERVPAAEAFDGDLICFRIGRIEHHCGVLIDTLNRSFVHSVQRYGVRMETLGPQWEKRVVSIFRPIIP